MTPVEIVAVIGVLTGGFVLFELRRYRAAFAPQPQPRLRPYRDVIKQVRVEADDSTVTVRLPGIDEALQERDKYLHALEAIATLGHDNTAQGIALQALGRKK